MIRCEMQTAWVRRDEGSVWGIVLTFADGVAMKIAVPVPYANGGEQNAEARLRPIIAERLREIATRIEAPSVESLS